MWQAVETSIQSLNKNRRLNISFRKTTTSNIKNCFVFSFRSRRDERVEYLLCCLVLEGPSAVHPISRPTSSITELMKKTRFTKDEIRHFYRTFKQVTILLLNRFFIIKISSRIVHLVKWVKNILHRSSVAYFPLVVNLSIVFVGHSLSLLCV